MKTFNNNNKYLDSSLINSCFNSGSINYVDKQVTGNGFTTGFANIKPAKGKTNILIVPNISVAEDKKREYGNHNFGFDGAKIGFKYKGSEMDQGKRYDIIVMVADTFVYSYYSLNLIDRSDKILIDEVHTVEIQSSFRRSLTKMQRIISESFNEVSVVYVTATPNTFTPVDITIKNNVNPTILNISYSIEESIDRVIESINKNKDVLIFTNNASLVVNILNKSKRNDINFIGGDMMLSSLFIKKELNISRESNITVVTSAGFEGWSNYSNKGNVFIFANYTTATSSFLGSNVYQAVGRLRNGAQYSELCIHEGGGNVVYHKNLIDILKSLESKKCKTTEKQQTEYRFNYKGSTLEGRNFIKFVEFYNDKEEVKMRINYNAVNVHNELIKAKNDFIKCYSKLFTDRKVTLNVISEADESKLKIVRTSKELKISNLSYNLSRVNTPYNYCFFREDIKKVDDLINQLFIFNSVNELLEINTDLGLKALNFISHEDFTENLLKKFIDSKYSIKESKEYFEEVGLINSLKIIKSILKKETPSKYRGHRDYNVFTTVSNNIFEYIAEHLGIKFFEIDIRNAYPRIVYAINNIKFCDEDFYNIEGIERKSAKIKVNAILNNLSTDFNTYTTKRKRKGLKSTLNQFKDYIVKLKKNQKATLKKYNFDDVVIDWLLNNFTDDPFRGKLFNLLSYHERIIIKKATEEIDAYNECVIFRKHDAILIFSNNELHTDKLYIEHLNENEWF